MRRRRETPSEELLIPEGRLILFILAKSTSDCGIRKYYPSIIHRLIEGSELPALAVDFTDRTVEGPPRNSNG